MSVLNKLAKLANKSYRDSYMQMTVRGGIAYQIQALRDKFGLTQAGFAERTGKQQSVISRLENTEYGKVSVQTLLDIASALDVALLIRFVSYPEFLRRTEDKSVVAMQPDTIRESLRRGPQRAAEVHLQPMPASFGRHDQQAASQNWSDIMSSGSMTAAQNISVQGGSPSRLPPFSSEPSQQWN